MNKNVGLVVVMLLLVVGLSGCVGSNGGASKDRTSGAPTASSAPTNSTAPTNTTAPTPSPTPTGNTTGNNTGTNQTAAGGSDFFTFKGTFTASGTVRTVHEFQVKPGAKVVHAYLVWDDAVSDETTGRSSFFSDLSLFLKNAAGQEVATAATSDFEYIRFNDTKKIDAGKWKLETLPTQVAVETKYQLNVTVFYTTPKISTFTGQHDAAASAASSGTFPYIFHKVLIPSSASAVTARLTWIDKPTQGTAGAQPVCGRAIRVVTDYDLLIMRDTKSFKSSASAGACEFTSVNGLAGAPVGDGKEWDFRVRPYTVVQSTYTLVVEYV